MALCDVEAVLVAQRCYRSTLQPHWPIWRFPGLRIQKRLQEKGEEAKKERQTDRQEKKREYELNENPFLYRTLVASFLATAASPTDVTACFSAPSSCTCTEHPLSRRV